MDITILLNRTFADTTQPINSDAYWAKCLQAAAYEIQGLNAAMVDILPEPIPCNPDAEIIEGYLGVSNTVPSEYGYCNVRLPMFRKLIPPPGISPTTFSFVLGEPIEDNEHGAFYAAGRFA